MNQFLVISNDRGDFDKRVNSHLRDGAMMIPGSLTIALTCGAKAGYVQGRYAIVLTTPVESNDE